MGGFLLFVWSLDVQNWAILCAEFDIFVGFVLFLADADVVVVIYRAESEIFVGFVSFCFVVVVLFGLVCRIRSLFYVSVSVFPCLYFFVDGKNAVERKA